MTAADKGQSSSKTVDLDKYCLAVKRHVALDAVKFGSILTRKQYLGPPDSYAVGVEVSFLVDKAVRA